MQNKDRINGRKISISPSNKTICQERIDQCIIEIDDYFNTDVSESVEVSI